MTLDNTLYWKTHIDQLLRKLSSGLSKFYISNVKISSACYTISVFKQIMPQETSSNCRLCLFSLQYELWYIFGGKYPYCINIFRLQKKKVVRIITYSKNQDLYHDLFRILNILTLQFQYIFSLLCFVIMNRGQQKLNFNVHDRNMRQSPIFIRQY